MKLSRKWAKVVTLFIWGGIGIYFLSTALIMLSPEYFYLKLSIMIFGSLLWLLGFILMLLKCRCPYCGKSVALPKWGKSKVGFCPKCGKELEYDDNH